MLTCRMSARMLPLPAGEGWGGGERPCHQGVSGISSDHGQCDASPSPSFPLPLGEGGRPGGQAGLGSLFCFYTRRTMRIILPMLLEFAKMNGAGNDFLLLDNRDGKIQLTREQIVRLCDRHRGVGADGVLLLVPSRTGRAD